MFRPRSIDGGSGHRWYRSCWTLAVLLIFCPGLAGCSFGSAPALSRQENTLRLPWYGRPGHFDPGILDPARASPSTSLLAASLTNTGLVKFSPDLHVIPDLAVSIPTISSNGRNYTFTIRQDARYADGRSCTAADVVYSLARALSPREHSPLAARYLGGISGARAVENGRARTLSGVHVLHRLTVRIHLDTPDATFLDKLAFPVAAIVSRHGAGGLGPFVRVRSTSPAILQFAPRSHYFGGQIHLDAVQLIAVRNAATALDMYRKGLLDAAWVPPAKMSDYSDHAEFSSSNSLDGYYAVAPASEGAYLAALLDRDRLLRDTGPALGPLESIVPSAVPDYVSSPPSIPTPDGVVAHPPGPVLLRVAQPRDRLSQDLRTALQQQWFTSRAATKTVWIVHATFFLPDPSRWLDIISHGAPAWYESDLRQANALTNDPVSRMSMYSDVETWALSKGVIIPLATGNLAYVTKPNVQSLDVTPTGLMPGNNSWSLVAIT